MPKHEGSPAPGDAPSPPPRHTPSAREQTVSYADLMKPDEDWRTLPNAADRRKIQNRLAQRAYRRSLRERNEEIKRLKKQVEKLEGTQGQTERGTPPVTPDTGAGPSLTRAGTTPDANPVHSVASVIPTSDWMGDYLSILPHTPGSDTDPFGGLSHGQIACEVWGSGFSGMSVAPESLMQVPTDHGSEHAGAPVETIRPELLSCCPQHHGDSDSSSSSTGGGDVFTYPLLPLGSDILCHSRGQPLATGDSTPTGSPTLKPFTFGNNGQRLRPVTSKLNAYDAKDVYSDDNSPGKASPFPSHARMAMGSGVCNGYHDGFHHSHTSAPWYCCKPNGSHAACTPDFSGRTGSHPGQEHQRPRTLVQPLDMDSLCSQGQFLHHGLLVEPSECGDGVTIRLQPTAANGRASLVAFMIQHDQSPLGDNNQVYTMDHDSR